MRLARVRYVGLTREAASLVGRAGGLRAQDGGEVVADDYALDQGAWLHPAGVRVAAGFAG